MKLKVVRGVILALSCLVGLLTAGVVMAGQTVTLTLKQLGTETDVIRLQGWDARYTVKIPRAPREAYGDTTVHLEGANSPALIRSRSALTVRLAGTVLQTKMLNPEDNRFVLDIKVPNDLLKAGYNELSITAVQHYTYQCEDPLSSELWTELDALRSTVTTEVKGLRPNESPKLSQLPLMFDARAWVNRPITFIYGGVAPSPTALQASTSVVQGLTLLKQGRVLDLHVASADTAGTSRDGLARLPGVRPEVAQGSDLVLVGERSELAAYLDGETSKLIAGPFVGVLPLNGGAGVALIVSGTTGAELLQAARAVANVEFMHQDAAFERPVVVTDAAPSFEAPLGARRPFSRFKYVTSTRHGVDSTPMGFEFRVPGELVGRKDLPIKFRMHISYGAGLRATSVLNLKVNGKFVTAVALDSAAGAELRDLSMEVPSSVVGPGLNYVHFQPVLTAEKAPCDMMRPEHMVVTVFEDSTIELPGSSEAPALPDLQRFVRSAWPYEGSMRVYPMSPRASTTAAVLSLASGLAQQQKRYVPFEILGRHEASENEVLVGEEALLPPDIARGLSSKGRYSWNTEGSDVRMTQGLERGRLITAIVAKDAGTLFKGTQLMSTAGLWGSVSGAVVVVNIGTETVSVEPVVEAFQLPNQVGWQKVLAQWQMLVSVALVLSVLVVWAWLKLLRRKADKRATADKE